MLRTAHTYRQEAQLTGHTGSNLSRKPQGYEQGPVEIKEQYMRHGGEWGLSRLRGSSHKYRWEQLKAE
ncbi:MAG: hypothetical protein MK033_05840 [Candidatus Caenarcaniphilales bacterium]|nr:hypothetical protein [Candidatus Caenarcaniphilales bacterium]